MINFIIKIEAVPIEHRSFLNSYINETRLLGSKLLNESDYNLEPLVEEFMIVLRIYPEAEFELHKQHNYAHVLKFGRKNKHLVIGEYAFAERFIGIDEKRGTEIMNETILICINKIKETKGLEKVNVEQLYKDIKIMLECITIKQIHLNMLAGF